MLNEDYKDILCALADAKAEYLVVGAYAMAMLGYPRTTMDIDVWVSPSVENSLAVYQALKNFGAPLSQVNVADFQEPDLIFQIGVAPCRIDIITGVSGLEFDSAYARAERIEIDGLVVPCLSKSDIIVNKQACGRTKDLADIEYLQRSLDEIIE